MMFSAHLAHFPMHHILKYIQVDKSLVFSVPCRLGQPREIVFHSGGRRGQSQGQRTRATPHHTAAGGHALTQGWFRSVSRLGRLSGANIRQAWIKFVAYCCVVFGGGGGGNTAERERRVSLT